MECAYVAICTSMYEHFQNDGIHCLSSFRGLHVGLYELVPFASPMCGAINGHILQVPARQSRAHQCQSLVQALSASFG
eukprot:6480596-Amphidinium_carterae.1